MATPDHSAHHQVDLQGVNFQFENIITPLAIETHKKCLEEKKAEEDAEQEKQLRLAEQKANAIIEQLAPAVERSSKI